MKNVQNIAVFGGVLVIVGAASLLVGKTDFWHGFGIGIIIAGAITAGIGLSLKAK